MNKKYYSVKSLCGNDLYKIDNGKIYYRDINGRQWSASVYNNVARFEKELIHNTLSNDITCDEISEASVFELFL